MKNIFIVSLILVFFGFSENIVGLEVTSGEKGTRSPTMADYKFLWDKYTTNPKNEKGQNSDFYRIVAVEEKSAMVYFTKEDNPAHPSYFKIFVDIRSNGAGIAKAGFQLESFTLGNEDEYRKIVKKMSELTLVLSKRLEDGTSNKSK